MNKKKLESILRVNQAGEYGATRIYAGQRHILGKDDSTLKHMAEQEEEHLKAFNQLMIKHRVRPSVLQPIWYIGGFAMGALSAALGRTSAHACTIAVEDVIENHYGEQLSKLNEVSDTPDIQEIKQIIQKCQSDEIEHKNHATAEGGLNANGFSTMNRIIQRIVKTSITVARKI